MDNDFKNKITLYQRTVIFSVIFTLIGFSYNVWRMEASEQNNNIRTASFEMLLNLSSLEQLAYAAFYDGNTIEGNPRKGWVVVGLIADLSVLTNDSVELKATKLNAVWANHWENINTNQKSVNIIVSAIDDVRGEIKYLLNSLE